MKKKLLAMLLALSMLTALFTACGNNPASSAAPSEPSQASEAPPAEDKAPSEQAPAEEASAPEASSADDASPTSWPATPLGNVDLPLTDEPVTVTMWMGVNPNVLKITEDIGNDCALWNELATRTGVNLEFTVVNPDTESEKFNLMVASNDLSDIISNATTLYTNGGEAAVADEILIDHLPYLTEELTPQICKLMEEYPDAVPEALTESGWLAGMPQLSMQTETTQTFGPMIRKDWLEALDLEVPQTYDDYKDVLLAFKNAYNCSTPLALSSDGVPENNYLVAGYGVAGKTADEGGTNMPFYVVDGQVKYSAICDYFCVIGDCKKPRDVRMALKTAYAAAMRI